ncbi:hypothetical protein Tco_0751110 [Tanacetum coccineum]|uniref:Xylulose kinase-1 n=1 Tax=Tanacetum coccineum TaxID=301880 RepID=A0ABQ4Z357_9ASTR
MTTLQFADTHNLVAFLTKPAKSKGFEQIVNFLNANPIRYALTINPTIYTSCIKQFWATVKAKTVNGKVQLQALVDGKKIIITELIVRRDLQLEDAEGINCLPNATIFEQLTLMGYEKVSQKLTFYLAFFSPQWKFLIHTVLQCLSAKTTAWNELSSTMASAIICLDTNQKFNFLKYIFESMVKNLENLSGKFLMRPKRKDTEIPQFSGPTNNVADEAVNEEMDDSLERAATITTSLDAEQDRGNMDKTQSKTILNEPSSLGTSLGYILRSGEDRLKLEELMEFCTKLQQRGLGLENTKTAQAEEMKSLKLRVKKLEKKGGSRTHKLKRLYKVGRSARMVSSDDASLEITLIDETQGRYGDDLMFDTCVLDDEEVFAGQDMDEKKINVAEKEVSTADPVTTAEIRNAKSKVKWVVIGDQSESTTRTRPQQIPSKDKGKGIMEEPEKPTNKKDQIRHDKEVAQRLQAQMQAELEEEDRLVRQREEEANIVSWDNVQAMIDADYQMAQQMQAGEQEILIVRAREKRNKPPTKAQKRNTMSTCLKNMDGYKHNQLKNKSFDDIQKLFNKAMKRSSSKRAGTKLEQESIKKQKVDEDKETTEIQRLIEVVPDKEEVAIDAIPLATKPPSIMYLVFSHMLKSFDREDLETLWKLVKAKHGSTRPEEGYERVIWGDLKTMFNPYVKDPVWRNQQDYKVLD